MWPTSRPGMYVTAIAITGLILVHATVAILSVYLFETAASGQVHGFILAAIGVGAVTGVAAVAKSAFGLVQKAEISTVGNPVSEQEAPELWKQADTVARKLGALRPDHIVIGLEPTFFVTEANMTTLTGRRMGRTLVCSLPLSRLLTVDEFSAHQSPHGLASFPGRTARFVEG